MKKKFLSIILASIFCLCGLGMLAGCGATGQFYTVKEAYESGLLTKENLQTVADFRDNGQRQELSDKKLIDEMKEVWAKHLHEHSETFSEIKAEQISVSDFYGQYGDCYVVFLSYGETIAEYAPCELEVGGVVFHFSHYLYKDRFVVYQKTA